MTSDLAASYPQGEYLIGNFITDYVSNYAYYDRYIVKLHGDKGIEVDKTAVISDIAIEWTFDINAIVFTHMKDWAKMYSASLKDYEPLWNVDGTVETTYGATHKEDNYAQKTNQDQWGKQSQELDYGARHSEDFNPTHTDTSTQFNTAYPDGLSKETSKGTNEYGAFTAEHDEDRVFDTVDKLAYNDSHIEGAHKDTFDENQHIDTERRTGNIGVTKSTELIESEYKLRQNWNFYKLIFGYIIREMGCIYYDWH